MKLCVSIQVFTARTTNFVNFTSFLNGAIRVIRGCCSSVIQVLAKRSAKSHEFPVVIDVVV